MKPKPQLLNNFDVYLQEWLIVLEEWPGICLDDLSSLLDIIHLVEVETLSSYLTAGCHLSMVNVPFIFICKMGSNFLVPLCLLASFTLV